LVEHLSLSVKFKANLNYGFGIEIQKGIENIKKKKEKIIHGPISFFSAHYFTAPTSSHTLTHGTNHLQVGPAVATPQSCMPSQAAVAWAWFVRCLFSQHDHNKLRLSSTGA
jgi:hypothetical protein